MKVLCKNRKLILLGKVMRVFKFLLCQSECLFDVIQGTVKEAVLYDRADISPCNVHSVPLIRFAHPSVTLSWVLI